MITKTHVTHAGSRWVPTGRKTFDLLGHIPRNLGPTVGIPGEISKLLTTALAANPV